MPMYTKSEIPGRETCTWHMKLAQYEKTRSPIEILRLRLNWNKMKLWNKNLENSRFDHEILHFGDSIGFCDFELGTKTDKELTNKWAKNGD